MKPIKYIAIAEAGKFRIVNDKLFREELSRLGNGRYDLIIQKHRRSKSNPQLGYLFGCVYPLFLRAAIDFGWEDFTSVDDVDVWCKSMFAGKEIINRQTGQILSVPGLKRDMTTTEMSAFTNQVRDYAAENFGCYIPGPMEQMKIEL